MNLKLNQFIFSMAAVFIFISSSFAASREEAQRDMMQYILDHPKAKSEDLKREYRKVQMSNVEASEKLTKDVKDVLNQIQSRNEQSRPKHTGWKVTEGLNSGAAYSGSSPEGSTRYQSPSTGDSSILVTSPAVSAEGSDKVDKLIFKGKLNKKRKVK